MISAVTVNYNGFNDTQNCVKSLQAANSFDTVVVVDNPKQENDRRLEALNKNGLKIIYNERNVGFGAANNNGIDWILANTSSQYILIINNDTVLQKDAVDVLLNEADEQTGILTSKIYHEDERQKLWYAGARMDWKRGVPHVFKREQQRNSAGEQPRYVTFASGCALLVKRTVFEQLGGFDERYFMYEEDVDFCLRAIENGFKIKYVPDSVIYHKVNASVGNSSNFGIFHPANEKLLFFISHRVQNRIINVIAHGNFLDKLKFVGFFGAVSVVKNVQYLFKGDWSAIRTYISAIKNGIKKGIDKHKNGNAPLLSSTLERLKHGK